MQQIKSHPLLVAHLTGISLLIVAHLWLGGYDGSSVATLVFFTGTILSFLGWLFSEAMFVVAPIGWQAVLHPILPHLVAVFMAYGLDRFFFNRRQSKKSGSTFTSQR